MKISINYGSKKKSKGHLVDEQGTAGQDLDMVEEYNWKTSTGCINRARAGSTSYKS